MVNAGIANVSRRSESAHASAAVLLGLDTENATDSRKENLVSCELPAEEERESGLSTRFTSVEDQEALKRTDMTADSIMTNHRDMDMTDHSVVRGDRVLRLRRRGRGSESSSTLIHRFVGEETDRLS